MRWMNLQNEHHKAIHVKSLFAFSLSVASDKWTNSSSSPGDLHVKSN